MRKHGNATKLWYLLTFPKDGSHLGSHIDLISKKKAFNQGAS